MATKTLMMQSPEEAPKATVTLGIQSDAAFTEAANALSDREHPCQAIADFMTLEERFGSVEGLKFTYIGDGNNVCHSLMLAAAQLGAHCTVATPKNFGPKLDFIHKAMAIAETTGGSI